MREPRRRAAWSSGKQTRRCVSCTSRKAQAENAQTKAVSGLLPDAADGEGSIASSALRTFRSQTCLPQAPCNFLVTISKGYSKTPEWAAADLALQRLDERTGHASGVSRPKEICLEFMTGVNS